MNAKIFLPGFLLTFIFQAVLPQISDASWLTSGPIPVEVPGFIMGTSVNGEEYENKNVLSHSYISLAPGEAPPEKENNEAVQSIISGLFILALSLVLSAFKLVFIDQHLPDCLMSLR